MGEVGALIGLLVGRASALGWGWAIGCAIALVLICFFVFMVFGKDEKEREPK